MKIGILTLPVAENYGGTMQAVALYRLLHNSGHDVFLIYKVPYVAKWKKIITEILLKIPFHNFRDLKTHKKLNAARKKRKDFHRPFIEKEIFKISDELVSTDDLSTFVKREGLEAVIVGSDQVWRKDYINDKFYKSYFLDFINNNQVRKVSYAASFGKDHWEGRNDQQEISALLHEFNAVSSRESSGIEICKQTFSFNEAVHVLDPTLLMSQDFYLQEIVAKHKTPNCFRGGLLTYVLDEAEDKKLIIEHLKKSLNINTINHLKGFNKGRILYSVPEWLKSMAEAEYVVTDSFHGMAFSIIFQKNFTVIGNPNRGLDRFKSLLSSLGLLDRLILSYEDLQDKTLGNIEYNKVNLLLEKNRQSSLSFLLNGLSDNDGHQKNKNVHRP